MARFRNNAHISELTGGGVAVTVAAHATNHTLLASITGPTNRKTAVRFRVWGRGISATGTHVRLSVRRGADLALSSGSAIALTAANGDVVKVNGNDAETSVFAATGLAGYSGQPTNQAEDNGSFVDQGTMHPQQEWVGATHVVNGGEVLSLWGITLTNAVAVDILMEVEE